jgi:hypothetical protein
MMTARKPIRLSYEALHRIRLAAGAWPADLDYKQLERQLSKAVYDYRQLSVRNIKAQKARLKAIHGHASAMAPLLSTEEEEGGVDWFSEWPKELPPLSKVAKEIARMIEESAVVKMSAQKIMREIILGSPLEWLVATRLPEVFEQFFPPLKVTRYLKGNYVRFVHQICKEYAIEKPMPSTTIRALTNARSGRGRKRHDGQK